MQIWKDIKILIQGSLFKYFPKYWCRHHSYSQDGEDMIIRSFYEEAYKYKGFYIDIGAHHPFRFSNTAYFYKKGWQGLNVEASPDLIKHFIDKRTRDINLNVGVSDKKDILRFFMFREPAVNTFDAERAKVLPLEDPRFIFEKEVEIQTLPLKEILDKHLPKGVKIDFLTIDVEGFDLQVLHSNDWDTYLPRFILVEHGFNPYALLEDPIFIFLSERNYELVARTKRTSIFQFKESGKSDPINN